MKGLKIRIYKDGNTKPDTTISIPIAILRFAKKLMPKQAASALHEYGVDLNEIVALAEQDEIRGTLLEVERHRKNEKIILSVE